MNEAFNTVWDLIPNTLKKTVANWTDCRLLQNRTGEISAGTDRPLEAKKQLADQMIADFHNWKREQI